MIRKQPFQKQKLYSEEKNTSQLIKNIKKSPTYKIAFKDKEFLSSYQTRGIRLELDYLKAELEIEKQGIRNTIIVFGSARIKEYKIALNELKEIEKKLSKNPNDRKLLRELYKAERMVGKSIYYEDAREFGRLVGLSGDGANDNRLVIATGGGPGIMEAANRGSFDVGAKSIGFNIQLPFEQFPNPYITPNLCFLFHYFAIRKMHFLKRAKALVVYPGGFGTLDELFESLTLIQTDKSKKIPIVLVGKKYWKKVIDFEFLKDEAVIDENDLKLFKFVDNAKEAWEYIQNWYKKRRKKLI